MNDTLETSFISQKDRLALAWLWQSYLRRYIFSIIAVTGLVTIYGLALIWILHLLNENFASLFSPDQGIYTFKEGTLAAHEAGEFIDANKDGIYDIEIKFIPAGQEQTLSAFLQVGFGAQQPPSGEIPYLNAQDYLNEDGSVRLDASAFTAFVNLRGGKIEAVTGTDAAHLLLVREGASKLLLQLFLILIVATLVRVCSAYLSTRLAERVSAYAALDIRRDLIARLMALDLAYFDQAQTGGIILALNEMVKGVQLFFSSTLLNAARALMTIIGVMGYLLSVHAGLFLLIILIFPIAIFCIREVSNRLRGYMESGLTATANYITNLENISGGIRTIKLTNQSSRAKQTLINDATEIANIQVRMSKYVALIAPLVDLLAALAVMGIVGLGGVAVMNGWFGLTGNTLITFVIGLALIFSPASRLSGFQAAVISALVALQGLYSLNNQRPTIVDADDGRNDFDKKGDIQFSKVAFAYSQTTQTPVLNSLNLIFKGGETSALVGQTGSGKTTVFSLISRLYDVTGGAITIGGVDIRDIKGVALRDAFSVVTQDAFIFDSTILENIRFVKPDASEEEVQAAAEKAQLTSLIKKKGLATVGPRGAQLSGGQKQRIAIARAFLKDAPIVLLDEATSALDQQTEEKITSALRTLCAGKTTIIIAHRLSTITHAHEIFVLEGGEVIETGNHNNLMEQKSLYSSLYTAQQKGVETKT